MANLDPDANKRPRQRRVQADGAAGGSSSSLSQLWEPGLLRQYLVIVLIAGVAFALGLAVGYSRVAPVPQLLTAREKLRIAIYGRPAPQADVESQIFVHPIVDDLVYPPMPTLKDIKSVNDRIFVDVADFNSAYRRLTLRAASKLRVGRSTILRVNFALAGKEHEAYAYIVDPRWHPASRKPIGMLIIPGTGINMSSQMLEEAAVAGGQTWLPAFRRPDADLFLLIKPNEDAFAFHNGDMKLSPLVINNYHLNRGGSYAASYLVQSLALTKYLRSHYPQLVVGGLSQGGAATLLNAIQSDPDVAVVSSGYSALGNSIEVSDFQQIVIPNLWRSRLPRDIAATLRRRPTQFLFTYGRNGTPLYRWDAQRGYTCKLMAANANVTCKIHGGGHEFPIPDIRAFLEAKLGRPAAGRR